MATLYKRKELRPIPEGATIKQYRGKACAVWTDRHGKMQRAPLNAAGDRMVQVADNFTVQYFDADGKRRKAPTGTPDKATAERIAAKIENEVAERRRGLIDTKAERYAREARRPIHEHLADFSRHLADKGSTAGHIAQTTRQGEAIISDCKVERIDGLTGAAVMRAIGERRAGGGTGRPARADHAPENDA